MSESRVTNALVGVPSILFTASVVLLVVQLTTSSAAQGNWFSRIMVSGSGAFFVTAVLWRLLEKHKWPVGVKVVAVVLNFGLVVFLLLALTSALWP